MFTANIGTTTGPERKTVIGAAKAALKNAPTGHIRMEINENGSPLFVVHAEDPEDAIAHTKQMLARCRR